MRTFVGIAAIAAALLVSACDTTGTDRGVNSAGHHRARTNNP
jgi:predicted small secreted protein